MDIDATNIDQIVNLISYTSKIACDYYHRSQYGISIKQDRSEVTDADTAISELLINGLKDILPNIPVISEEMSEEDGIKIATSCNKFWLIDPIDGTKCFINKSGNFTINAALIDNGSPVFGIISEPLLNEVYYTDPDIGAVCVSNSVKRSISCNDHKDAGLDLVLSVRNRDALQYNIIKDLNIKSTTYISSSYKFCMVADGRADLYPQLGRTCTWDIAAGEALLVAAGGFVESIYGKDMEYTRDVFDNPPFFAMNKQAYMLINNSSLQERTYDK